MEIKKNHHQQNPPVYKSHLTEESEAAKLLSNVGARTFFNYVSKVKVLVLLICVFINFLQCRKWKGIVLTV